MVSAPRALRLRPRLNAAEEQADDERGRERSAGHDPDPGKEAKYSFHGGMIGPQADGPELDFVTQPTDMSRVVIVPQPPVSAGRDRVPDVALAGPPDMARLWTVRDWGCRQTRPLEPRPGGELCAVRWAREATRPGFRLPPARARRA
jgi:hypothetical protein